MTTLSNSRFTIAGDIDTGRGQLGIGWAGTAVTGTLWGLRSGGNHYAINCASNITITLPDVGTGSTQAQPGYWATIINTSSTNSITVNNFGATLINTLPAGKSAMYIAVATSFAATNWVLQYDTTTYDSSGTLQQAYNASGTANPQILLNTTFGAVKIQDNSTPIGATLFNVLNSTGNPIFRVGNTTFPNSVSVFSGSVGASNSFGVGSSSLNGAGSVLLGDSTIVGSFTGATIFYQVFTGGSWAYAGSVQEGTTKTSPNRRTLYFLINAVTTSGVATNLFTPTANTSYQVTVTAYGRDATNTSAVSATHIIDALVTNITGTLLVVSQQLRTIETPGYTSIPSNAVLSINSTNVSITLTAPDNTSAGTMDYRVILEYSALTE